MTLDPARTKPIRDPARLDGLPLIGVHLRDAAKAGA